MGNNNSRETSSPPTTQEPLYRETDLIPLDKPIYNPDSPARIPFNPVYFFSFGSDLVYHPPKDNSFPPAVLLADHLEDIVEASKATGFILAGQTPEISDLALYASAFQLSPTLICTSSISNTYYRRFFYCMAPNIADALQNDLPKFEVVHMPVNSSDYLTTDPKSGIALKDAGFTFFKVANNAPISPNFVVPYFQQLEENEPIALIGYCSNETEDTSKLFYGAPYTPTAKDLLEHFHGCDSKLVALGCVLPPVPHDNRYKTLIAHNASTLTGATGSVVLPLKKFGTKMPYLFCGTHLSGWTISPFAQDKQSKGPPKDNNLIVGLNYNLFVSVTHPVFIASYARYVIPSFKDAVPLAAKQYVDSYSLMISTVKFSE